MRLLVLTSILCAGLVPRASAQERDPWLIVVTSSSVAEAWVGPTASRVRAELLHQGVEVWSSGSSATRFEAKGSAAAAVVSEAELEAWAAQSRAGLWRLAMGDTQAALDELSEAQQLSRGAIEELNRTQEGARAVLDTCLYMLRALLETGLESEGKALAPQCRALVPRGEPSANMHPALVLQILDGVDASHAEQTATLRVQSEPSGCAVRVNGLMFGETPLQVADLLPAQYRVQVECDPRRRGRVHIADTNTGPAEVFVDSRFDRAIKTTPLVHLHYASVSDEREHRVDDAEQIAKALPASALLLMSMPAPRALELELLRGTPRQKKALGRIAMGAEGPSWGDIALAARALVNGQCTDFTGTRPVALPCAGSAEAIPEGGWPSDRRPRGQFISGLVLAGVGSAALITGHVLTAPRARVAEDWIAQLDSGAPPDGVAQQQWLTMGTAVVLTSSLGAAALVAAMPLALPSRAKTSWWAWLAGGVGVGLAAFSVAYGLTAEAKPDISCPTLTISSADAQTCIRHAEQTSVAILTGATAAPLLTIPLVYLLRRGDARLTPGVEVSRAGGYLSIRGEF